MMMLSLIDHGLTTSLAWFIASLIPLVTILALWIRAERSSLRLPKQARPATDNDLPPSFAMPDISVLYCPQLQTPALYQAPLGQPPRLCLGAYWRELSADVQQAIFAHELAHHNRHHARRLRLGFIWIPLLCIILTAVIMWLCGLQPSQSPFFIQALATIFSLIGLILLRKQLEREADRVAIDLLVQTNMSLQQATQALHNAQSQFAPNRISK